MAKTTKSKSKSKKQVIVDSPSDSTLSVTTEINTVQPEAEPKANTEQTVILPDISEPQSLNTHNTQTDTSNQSTDQTIAIKSETDVSQAVLPVQKESVKVEYKTVTPVVKEPTTRVITWKFIDSWYNRHENFKMFALPQQLDESIVCYNQVRQIKNVSIVIVDGQPVTNINAW